MQTMGNVQSRSPEVGAHLVGCNKNKEACICPEQSGWTERCRVEARGVMGR